MGCRTSIEYVACNGNRVRSRRRAARSGLPGKPASAELKAIEREVEQAANEKRSEAQKGIPKTEKKAEKERVPLKRLQTARRSRRKRGRSHEADRAEGAFCSDRTFRGNRRERERESGPNCREVRNRSEEISQVLIDSSEKPKYVR